jgi:hypothetical protein
MPIPRFHGSALLADNAGSRQVAAIPASKAASPPIDVGRLCRNGLGPDAGIANSLNEQTNQAVMYRSKQVFSCFGRHRTALGIVGGTDRPRWRFAFHTGPYTHALCAVVGLMPTDIDLDPYVGYGTGGKIEIFSGTTEGVTVSEKTFIYGTHPTGAGNASEINWSHYKYVIGYLENVPPDTDLTGLVSDYNYGRVQSVTIFELPSMTDNTDGYLAQNVTAQSQIVDIYREKQATVQRALWRRGAAHVFNWTVDDQDATVNAPITRTSATPINVIDMSSTTVSASTPGFTLDMQRKARLSQSGGVPCVIKAFGKMSAGAGGEVYLVNSLGVIVASVGGFGTTASWQSAAVDLPATEDKYDLFFANTSGVNTFTLYAVSCYQHES